MDATCIKGNVLLLASRYLDLYKDIMEGLQSLGYGVVWVEDDQIADNPFKIKYETCEYNEKNVSMYESKVQKFWENKNEEGLFTVKFDFFLAIDGLMVCPWLFTQLHNNNPTIQVILYLFDRVQGMYQIDRYFPYYDRVFSFDDNDVKQFNLSYLPIYWCPNKKGSDIKYDVFSLASYNHINPQRNVIYCRIKELACKHNLREYIKLYYRRTVGNQYTYLLKNIIKRILGHKTIPLSYYKVGLITSKSESPSSFRNLIMQSRCVLDVQPEFQAGFTARFMWALGLGKKIITTNPTIVSYPFYNENQFFVLTTDCHDEDILDFVMKPYVQSRNEERLVEDYRIDRWLSTILDFNKE